MSKTCGAEEEKVIEMDYEKGGERRKKMHNNIEQAESLKRK